MSGTNFDRVEGYYAAFDEWSRLETATGRLEFVRALGLLEKYLQPESRVLDLGGGPGRYTVALAEMGHRVCLADLSVDLLDIGREKVEAAGVVDRVESIDQVNATDLSRYADEEFDAVVIFGPFYHLMEVGERIQAASEIRRVLKAGGRSFVAFIPRLSGVSGLIFRAKDREPEKMQQVVAENFLEMFRTGRFRNQVEGGFQEGYCPRVEELEGLFVDAGFETVGIHSLRGLAVGFEEELWQVQARDSALFDAMMEVIEETSQERSVIDMGHHAVYVGEKT